MWPHRRQPTRLPCPWDSPGKNTGVGCHFLLQCMKGKSESEVAQSCLTLSDPMDCSLAYLNLDKIALQLENSVDDGWDSVRTFDAWNTICTSIDEHELGRATRCWEVIGINGNHRGVLCRVSDALKVVLCFCTLLHWWIKIRFLSKIRSVNILWVITRWICMGKRWDMLLLTSEVQI